jgi:hypothetical protein
MSTHVTRSVTASRLVVSYAPTVALCRRSVSSRLLCRLFSRASTTVMRLSPDHRPSSICQSVMNAGARLIFSVDRRDHVTPLLRHLHWLLAEQRVIFKVAVLAYRCIREAAPSCLSDCLHLVADLPGRSCLRSTSNLELVVPLTRLSTVGDRSFPVAAAKIWNSSPRNVTKTTSVIPEKNSRLFCLSLSHLSIYFIFLFIFMCLVFKYFIVIALKFLQCSH